MTSKELLHRLVDDLGEPQAAEAVPRPDDVEVPMVDRVGALTLSP
jgi:hypothetical protein